MKKRDRSEYLREYRGYKREKERELKREKAERYHMSKNDTFLPARPSSLSASPSTSSFAPPQMEAQRVSYLVPRYQVGDTLLLEANTKGRGYVIISFSFYRSVFFLTSYFGLRLRYQAENLKVQVLKVYEGVEISYDVRSVHSNGVPRRKVPEKDREK